MLVNTHVHLLLCCKLGLLPFQVGIFSCDIKGFSPNLLRKYNKISIQCFG